MDHSPGGVRRSPGGTTRGHSPDGDPSGRVSRVSARRGQAPVVAVVLLLAITVIGSVTVVAVGSELVSDAKHRIQDANVARAFGDLDRGVDAAMHGESRVVDVTLPEGPPERQSHAGRIVVRTSTTTGGIEVLDASLGAVTRDRYAYQAGGIWLGSGRNTEMIAPPAVDVADGPAGPTVTVSVPKLHGDVSEQFRLGPDSVTTTASGDPIFRGRVVVVEVSGPYYAGWAEYFRSLSGDYEVTVDHAARTATLRITGDAGQAPAVENAVAGGADGHDLVVRGALIDGYDSSVASYVNYGGEDGDGDTDLDDSSTVPGSVHTGDAVKLKQSSVTGDVETAGAATLVGGSVVGGSVHYGTTVSVCGSCSVDDDVTANGAAPSLPSIDGQLRGVVRGLDRRNDDDETSAIVDGAIDWEGACSDPSSCTLTLGAGEYHLEALDVNGSGRTLELDPNGKTVAIAVEERIHVGAGSIEVVGPGRVNVYHAGDRFVVENGGEVTVPGDEADRLWVYLAGDATVRLRGDTTRFVGALYGPDGTDVRISSGAEVYGALVGDVREIVGTDTAVHYDRALASTDVLTARLRAPNVTFVHASVARIDTED